jgi:hypothetical protein
LTIALPTRSVGKSPLKLGIVVGQGQVCCAIGSPAISDAHWARASAITSAANCGFSAA